MRLTADTTPKKTVAVPTTLAELRQLSPERPLTRREAEYVAERQANRLLAAAGVEGPPSPLAVASALDKVHIDIWPNAPVSGSCHWTGKVWMILINGNEPAFRRRFTAFHELKHAIDDRHQETMYSMMKGTEARPAPELIADYFAACLLMPKVFVRRAWTAGICNVGQLAYLFEVSPAAMRTRLAWLGLIERTTKSVEAAE